MIALLERNKDICDNIRRIMVHMFNDQVYQVIVWLQVSNILNLYNIMVIMLYLVHPNNNNRI